MRSVYRCYYLLSFRCGNPRPDSGFPLLVRDLVHCCLGDISVRAHVAAGEEDAPVVDPGDVVDSSGALDNDHID